MNIFSITFEEKDENKIPMVLTLADKYNAQYFEFDTKDGHGYEFEFFNDAERIGFKEAIDKIGLFI